jgi:hypothetical protein
MQLEAEREERKQHTQDIMGMDERNRQYWKEVNG